MKDVVEKINEIQCIEDSKISFGVILKEPLNFDLVQKGFDFISNQIPELSISDYNKDHKTFSLFNAAKDVGSRVILRIINFDSINLIIGLKKIGYFNQYTKVFFDLLKVIFEIPHLKIDILNLQIHNLIDIDENHYKFINDVFYHQSPINNLFERNNIITNNFLLRGQLNDSIIAVVRVESDQHASEILNNEFENKTLNCVCAVGKIRDFSLKKDLFDIFYEQVETTKIFINEKYIQNILVPIQNKMC